MKLIIAFLSKFKEIVKLDLYPKAILNIVPDSRRFEFEGAGCRDVTSGSRR
jgi:hypothetical protein